VSQTLLGRLVRVQAWVVVFSCSVLALGVAVASALVLRSTQDANLRSVQRELCRGVVYEMNEHHVDIVSAAREFFEEARMETVRFELFAHDGRQLAWDGAEADLAFTPSSGCGSLVDGSGGRWRACTDVCESTGFVLRASERDALGSTAARTVVWTLLGLLPLAALAGTLYGRAVFRRALLPLQSLERAAASAQPRSGLTLGVHARDREIAGLEQAFDGLLARLDQAMQRERRFTQDASHELRTPLTVLRARLERARAQAAPGGVEDIDGALAEVRRIDGLIESLVLLARADDAAIPMSPVNVCDLARQASAERARTDGAASPAPEVLASDEVLVRGSEDLLARIFDNLLDNARKFAGREARLRVHVGEEGDQVVLLVEDDGPGIAPEHRPRAFDRFFRSPVDRARVEGTGLGLAVVQSIVERHGGSVSTGPSPLGGEEVRVRLPRYRTA
jgi:signal transduction histidine kinase